MLPVSLNDRLNSAFSSIGIIVEDDTTDPDNENETKAKEGPSEKDSTRFVRTNDVDRSALLSAMKNAGHSVSSLARACDVEPSMISRLLREPATNDPDESARNPSIQLAARISSELNTSPESLFTDIFDISRSNIKPKHHKNRQQKTFK